MRQGTDWAFRAIEAFERGELGLAFAFIDRHCRTAPTFSQHFALRGQLRRFRGDTAAALSDFRNAYASDPTSDSIRRALLETLLAAGETGEANSRAREWLADAKDERLLAIMARVVGSESGRIALIQRDGTHATLILLGDAAELVEISVTSLGRVLHQGKIELVAVPDDPGAIARLSLPNLGREEFADLAIVTAPGAFETINATSRAPAGAHSPKGASSEWTRSRELRGVAVPAGGGVVIVPVFKDYEAVRACLTSVLDDPGFAEHAHLVVVNDASPEPKITRWLRSLALDERITLIENRHNLGFLKSVNRAFEITGHRDTVLLNADTMVPRGWFGRLREAAYSSESIGTVTPLSNNGEFTSFPVPFSPSPMPSAEELSLIDDAASELGSIVDLPSGIGFCLFIKGEVLERLGKLDEEGVQDGYLEEVEFCLRVRGAGFRNVCATGVYVGHIGTVSYGHEKRKLVVRNYKDIDRRWPDYRPETDAFVAADPLKFLRNALQRAVISRLPRRGRLVLAGRYTILRAIATIGELYGREAAEAALYVGFDSEDNWRELARSPDPTSSFYLQGPFTAEELSELLASMAAEELIIIDAAYAPELGTEAALEQGAKFTVILADGSFFCPRNDLVDASGKFCGLPSSKVCDVCVAEGGDRAGGCAGRVGAYRLARSRWLARATTFASANAAVLELSQESKVSGSEARQLYRTGRVRFADPPKRARLALIPFDRSAATLRTLESLALRFAEAGQAADMIVLGSTLDDTRLLARGIFVTGTVRDAELSETLAAYEVSCIFLPSRGIRFTDPRIAALAQCKLPIASLSPPEFSDTGLGAADLRLDPAAADEAVAEDVAAWCIALHYGGDTGGGKASLAKPVFSSASMFPQAPNHAL